MTVLQTAVLTTSPPRHVQFAMQIYVAGTFKFASKFITFCQSTLIAHFSIPNQPQIEKEGIIQYTHEWPYENFSRHPRL